MTEAIEGSGLSEKAKREAEPKWVNIDRWRLLQMLEFRRTREWKLGLIQGFCSCGKLSQADWQSLKDQIVAKQTSFTLASEPNWKSK